MFSGLFFLLENELHISNMKIIEDHKIRIYDMSYKQSEISRTLIMHDVSIEEMKKTLKLIRRLFLPANLWRW